MLESCIFCRISAGTAPASIVAETADALAFMDINQPTPGHVLVIPRKHVRDIYSLDDATASAVFALAVRVAKAVKAGLRADGINLYQANEPVAGQEVFHFHVHVIARYLGDRDRIRLFWQPNLPPRGELDRLAREIRTHLTGG